jgi:hypothetical protein
MGTDGVSSKAGECLIERFITDSSPIHRWLLGCGSRTDKGGEGMMDQEVVLVYDSHRYWHCWRTKTLLRHRSCDFSMSSGARDAEPGASLVYFMEEEDRR